MNVLKNLFFKALIFYVFPLSVLAVFIVSYLAMCKLVFPSELILSDGTKLSERANEIRESLDKRSDTKKVSFKTKDNIKISGYLTIRKGAIANLLVCHGYQSCKEFSSDVLDLFPNYNILLFDFRAHGQSDGKYRTLGCHEYKDVIAAVNFLKDKTKNYNKNLPLIILGTSMGGSTAIKALEYEPNLCNAIILDSSFSDLRTIIYHSFKYKANLPAYPFLPIIERMTNFLASCDIGKMCPSKNIKNVKQPILFIHSCIDNIVPPNDSLLLYANSLNNKNKIWIGRAVEHSKLRKKYPNIYKNKVEKFIKETGLLKRT
ncbi:alpha/beta fold hydrolase [Candidatus Dependentiae bacterium]|nr:alpha/beta fold hydrolase [Candidatus Dependentiae bacterium]